MDEFTTFDLGEQVMIDRDAETQFAGRAGTVVGQHAETGTVFVSIDNGIWHAAERWPFANSEVRAWDID
jgi:ribosomal protein L21E